MNNTLEEYLATEEAIPPELLDRHPLYDEYWAAKCPPLRNIVTPMLLCASFSDHELHTFGSFRAYEHASSTQKWLYTHRSGKWTEFYKTESLDLQKKFMDHFLKGDATDLPDLPRVRIEVRSSKDVVHEVRWEKSWPPENTEYTPLFLRNDGLSRESRAEAEELSYDGASGRAEFDFAFLHDTEVTGYMTLRLWVEVRGDPGEPLDDLIVCCFVDKRDRDGRSVRFNGAAGNEHDVVSRGYGRAARRALDEDASTPWHPAPAGTRHEPLSPGEVVPLEVAFCPSSTFYAKGERLRLIVSAEALVISAPP